MAVSEAPVSFNSFSYNEPLGLFDFQICANPFEIQRSH